MVFIARLGYSVIFVYSSTSESESKIFSLCFYISTHLQLQVHYNHFKDFVYHIQTEYQISISYQ